MLAFNPRLLAAGAAVTLAATLSWVLPLAALASPGDDDRLQAVQVVSPSLRFAALRPRLVAPGVMPAVHRNGASHALNSFGNLWVADMGANAVYRCTLAGCQTVGSGWNTPSDVTVDGSGNAYVTDYYNSRIVELSKSGTTIAIYADPGEYPSGVGVDPNGNLGVANYCSTASCGPGNIAFYNAGHTSGPTRTVTGYLQNFWYGSFDAAGDFINDGTLSNSGGVAYGVVFSGSSKNVCGNCTGGLYFAPVGSQPYPAGMRVTNAGAPQQADTVTIVGWSGSCCGLYEDPLLGNGSVNPPFLLLGASESMGFGFSHDDHAVAIADPGLAAVTIYSYPYGGSPLASVTGFNQPVSAALDPGGQY